MKKLLLIFFLLGTNWVLAATVTTNKTVYAPGETIVVSWTGAKMGVNDWIGIYAEGQTPSSSTPSLDWDYVTGISGSLNFPGRKTGLQALPVGRYVAILICCDGYKVKAKSIVFEVKSSIAPVLAINKITYASGENILLTYSGASGSAKDWIGIYFTGETPGTGTPAIIWKYVTGTQGSMTFQNTLTGGPFVAYLFCCDGYTKLATSPQFNVAPGTGTCSITSTPVVPDVITRIGFGSCASQTEPQPTIDVAINKDPDLFIYLGDNMYADTYNANRLKQYYQAIYGRPEFCRMKNTIPLIATWDDHDYGSNDEDKDYPIKAQSQQLFLDFWNEPSSSPRRSQQGIYTSYLYGSQPGKKVQVILLDTRYFLDNKAVNNGCGKNAYCASTNQRLTILGNAQWQWLEQQLLKPADLRIIASSITFGVEYNGWEGWGLFPRERDKMTDLIKSTGANGVVFISGDLHWSEISSYTSTVTTGLYPLYDFTSSGINKEFRTIEPNKYRIPGVLPIADASTGLFEIDWTNRTIKMSAFGASNNMLMTHTISMNNLVQSSGLTSQSSISSEQEKLIVYPNPSRSEVTVQIPSAESGTLKIVDVATGNTVKEISVEENMKGGQYVIPLLSGSYMASFITKNTTSTFNERFIINN